MKKSRANEIKKEGNYSEGKFSRYFILVLRITIIAELLNKSSASGSGRGQTRFTATKFRLIISFFPQSFPFKEAFCVLMIVL